MSESILKMDFLGPGVTHLNARRTTESGPPSCDLQSEVHTTEIMTKTESSASYERHVANFQAVSLYIEACEMLLMCVPACGACY